VSNLLKSRKLNPHNDHKRTEYCDTVTFIKVRNNLARKVLVLTGIRQRDSLSRILSNVVMDKVIKEAKVAGREYRMRDKEAKIVYSVDDAVIISKEEDNLRRLLRRFELRTEICNLSMSVQKKQSLVIVQSTANWRYIIKALTRS